MYAPRFVSDPASDTLWEVWCRDIFDRECPPNVEVRGRGLVRGLVELWARYLFETMRPDGSTGFSRFHMRWGETHSVAVRGSREGAARLRRWVFGDREHTRKGYVKAGDERLLGRVAAVHARLLLADRSSEEILSAAASSEDRAAFEQWLAER